VKRKDKVLAIAKSVEKLLTGPLGGSMPGNLLFRPQSSTGLAKAAQKVQHVGEYRTHQRKSQATFVPADGQTRITAVTAGPEFVEEMVAVIPNCRVYGSDGLTLTQDHILLENFYVGSLRTAPPAPFMQKAAYAKNQIFKRPERITGLTVPLLAPGSSGYYHFLLDALPRLFLIADSSFLPQRVESVLVNERFISATAFVLQVLGLEEWCSHLVPVGRRATYDCDEVLTTTPPTFMGWPSPNTLGCFSRLTKISREKPGQHKLYIGRDGRRKITNEDKLTKKLKEFGYLFPDLDSMRFEDQCSLFADASHVVGPHGAGLANVIFSPNAEVFEIMSPSYFNLSNATISESKGLHHIVCCVPQSIRPEHSEVVNDHEDFEVDVGFIMESLFEFGFLE
jgi:hypothetical protein